MQVAKPTQCVTRSSILFCLLNCIGEGLTTGSTDTLRVYSIDLVPQPAYPEGPQLCTGCTSEETSPRCDNCYQLLLLLQSVEQVTRGKLFVVARPTFSVGQVHDTSASKKLQDEVRYYQNILRPMKPPNRKNGFARQ